MARSIKMALYPIYMDDVPPHYTLANAFKQYFPNCYVYDWVNAAKRRGLPRAQHEFLSWLRVNKPEYTFMQLQNPANMTVKMARDMAKYTKIINWSGDVRQSKEWYRWFADIGREIHLTLFSNETDVEVLKSMGVKNVGYLQIAFDNGWYYKQENKVTDKVMPEIVFCANNYGTFQLSKYRADVAQALKDKYGDRFQLHGMGWKDYGFDTQKCNNTTEALLYNNCKIAISVSNFQHKRYYSDRLLRIMACGAFPLSHRYENIEADFKEGEDIVIFENTDHLIEQCEYYLNNETERQRIAENAMKTVWASHKWENRMEELIKFL
jgi:predicted metal-binding protein